MKSSWTLNRTCMDASLLRSIITENNGVYLLLEWENIASLILLFILLPKGRIANAQCQMWIGICMATRCPIDLLCLHMAICSQEFLQSWRLQYMAVCSQEFLHMAVCSQEFLQSWETSDASTSDASRTAMHVQFWLLESYSRLAARGRIANAQWVSIDRCG